MVAWCLLLFVLGVFGILQNSSVMSDPDRVARVITWVLMLIVLGILFRVRRKEKFGEKERLLERIEQLEEELRMQR